MLSEQLVDVLLEVKLCFMSSSISQKARGAELAVIRMLGDSKPIYWRVQ